MDDDPKCSICGSTSFGMEWCVECDRPFCEECGDPDERICDRHYFTREAWNAELLEQEICE